jgi:hypothetical protein
MPPLATPLTDLAFSSNIADALEIYALDEKGRIWHRWWWRDSGWSNGWTLMGTPGGRPVTAIAAGSYADYHQELFAIVDGEIWHSGWSGWEDFPVPDGSPLTAITATSDPCATRRSSAAKAAARSSTRGTGCATTASPTGSPGRNGPRGTGCPT